MLKWKYSFQVPSAAILDTCVFLTVIPMDGLLCTWLPYISKYILLCLTLREREKNIYCRM